MSKCVISLVTGSSYNFLTKFAIWLLSPVAIHTPNVYIPSEHYAHYYRGNALKRINSQYRVEPGQTTLVYTTRLQSDILQYQLIPHY
jgi:hypothetical protein